MKTFVLAAILSFGLILAILTVADMKPIPRVTADPLESDHTVIGGQNIGGQNAAESDESSPSVASLRNLSSNELRVVASSLMNDSSDGWSNQDELQLLAREWLKSDCFAFLEWSSTLPNSECIRNIIWLALEKAAQIDLDGACLLATEMNHLLPPFTDILHVLKGQLGSDPYRCFEKLDELENSGSWTPVELWNVERELVRTLVSTAEPRKALEIIRGISDDSLKAESLQSLGIRMAEDDEEAFIGWLLEERIPSSELNSLIYGLPKLLRDKPTDLATRLLPLLDADSAEYFWKVYISEVTHSGPQLAATAVEQTEDPRLHEVGLIAMTQAISNPGEDTWKAVERLASRHSQEKVISRLWSSTSAENSEMASVFVEGIQPHNLRTVALDVVVNQMASSAPEECVRFCSTLTEPVERRVFLQRAMGNPAVARWFDQFADDATWISPPVRVEIGEVRALNVSLGL